MYQVRPLLLLEQNSIKNRRRNCKQIFVDGLKKMVVLETTRISYDLLKLNQNVTRKYRILQLLKSMTQSAIHRNALELTLEIFVCIKCYLAIAGRR